MGFNTEILDAWAKNPITLLAISGFRYVSGQTLYTINQKLKTQKSFLCVLCASVVKKVISKWKQKNYKL